MNSAGQKNIIVTLAVATLAFLIGLGYFLPPQETNKFFKLVTEKPAADDDSFQEIRSIVDSIYRTCDQKVGECYVSKIKNELLSKYSPASILTALDDFNRFIGCHAFSHFLGRAVFEMTENAADAHALCDFTCFGGCYHGVLEEFLGNEADPFDATGETLASICRGSRALAGTKPPQQVYGECLHGFGHGFMFVTGSNLPKSLELCDRLADIGDRETCYGGALMENASSSTNPDHPSPWTREDDTFFPCTALAEKYLPQCYWYQIGGLRSRGFNFSQIFEECRKIPEQYRPFCFLGIGTNTTSGSENPVEVATETCALGRGDEKILCAKGAVISLMGRFGGGALEKVLEFCGQNPEDIKGECFKNFKDLALAWGKREELNLLCKNQKIKVLCEN